MKYRARFAPSPTGRVHIGNIRTAIFNWLFAKNKGGSFLLRIEDTDKERSTSEAIDKVLESMQWLGLDYDEEILYQSTRINAHKEAAEKLIKSKNAYKLGTKDDAPVAFRIPWETDKNPTVKTRGEKQIKIHPDVPVLIRQKGLSYSGVSKKGKPVAQAGCIGGFHQLKLYDNEDNCLFDIEKNIDGILNGTQDFSIENCSKMVFQQREVFFNDLVKGRLSKPLDTMKDLIILRGDGSPVFHLANVCDDAFQEMSHIIRGDDHVENTYRHIFLFQALGFDVPQYAHLPMIINHRGKPYSKRDGDAFVGDFKDKGYTADALFNFLILLGWSPGDNREKMTKEEIIEIFSLDRINSAPAQVSLKKLTNLNGQYIAEMNPEDFIDATFEKVSKLEWATEIDKKYLKKVALLLQSRTKLMTDINDWGYFFTDDIDYDEKDLNKIMHFKNIKESISDLQKELQEIDFSEEILEKTINKIENKYDTQQGGLNYPLRIILTGIKKGAGIYETMNVLGKDKVLQRLKQFMKN
ncbi:MAG: glutamate--tRNA ligase family protein [Verrucomicrobiota bacterium]|nr:glutamate--tRNA ligase family protein [Verrucomicrobiota bacterium]